jgi:hypothetical protein
MHAHMTSQEKALDRSIHYSIVQSDVLNADATKENGNREIIISSALIQAIDELATMNTVAFLWKRIDCLSAFAEYQRKMRTQPGPHPNATTNPWSYIKSHPSTCPQIRPEALYQNEKGSQELRVVLMMESVKWVLLHEFAHQLYGYFDQVEDNESRKGAALLRLRLDHDLSLG